MCCKWYLWLHGSTEGVTMYLRLLGCTKGNEVHRGQVALLDAIFFTTIMLIGTTYLFSIYSTYSSTIIDLEVARSRAEADYYLSLIHKISIDNLSYGCEGVGWLNVGERSIAEAIVIYLYLEYQNKINGQKYNTTAIKNTVSHAVWNIYYIIGNRGFILNATLCSHSHYVPSLTISSSTIYKDADSLPRQYDYAEDIITFTMKNNATAMIDVAKVHIELYLF